jgi:hypothetical protein
VIGRKRNGSYQLIASSLAAIVMLSGSILAGTAGVAQALLITEEEHWKYNIDRWTWDSDIRRTVGKINPQIVIQNETADRLEGYIGDTNGTRLEMYDGQQVVHIRFLSNSSVASAWELAGWVHDGYFVIEIPEKYKSAEIVKIYIGKHRYTVDNGTPTTPQTEVSINSAMINYRTNSTLDQIAETEIAQVEEDEPLISVYSSGSLIDWILRLNGMLPVRSSNPGE